MLTFKTLLLAHFQNTNGLGEIAKRLTYDAALGKLDGAALRDEIIRQDSELKIPLWELWNFMPMWRTCVERLPAEQPPPLVTYGLQQFMAATFPPCEPLAVDVNNPSLVLFKKRTLNQLFAYRGVGKTWIGLGNAIMLATGGQFLNWKATRPVKVLYVEGEMANDELQHRLRTLNARSENLRLLTLESQTNNLIPRISEPSGQQAIEDAIGDAEAVFFDSISTLAWIPTNDEENLLELLEWFNRLRTHGLCVVFLHHTGRLRQAPRGHSRIEDLLNVSIKLTRREEDEEVEHLKCALEYDKFRGDKVGLRSLLIELRGGQWRWKPLAKETEQLIAAAMRLNPKAGSHKLARELNIPQPTVWRTMKKLQNRQIELSENEITGEL